MSLYMERTCYKNIQDINDLDSVEGIDTSIHYDGANEKEIHTEANKESLDRLVLGKFLTREEVVEIETEKVDTLIFY